MSPHFPHAPLGSSGSTWGSRGSISGVLKPLQLIGLQLIGLCWKLFADITSSDDVPTASRHLQTSTTIFSYRKYRAHEFWSCQTATFFTMPDHAALAAVQGNQGAGPARQPEQAVSLFHYGN